MGAGTSGVVRGAIGAALVLSVFIGQASGNTSPELRQAENAIKMIIGLNHMQCAEVTYVAKLQGSVYGVTCTKKAGHKERVHYAVDAANNAVVGVR